MALGLCLAMTMAVCMCCRRVCLLASAGIARSCQFLVALAMWATTLLPPRTVQCIADCALSHATPWIRLHTLELAMSSAASKDEASASSPRSIQSTPLVDPGQASEQNMSALEHAGRLIIHAIGEKPGREGLIKTPHRFAKALLDCTVGYSQDAEAILKSALFDVECGDQLVTLTDIPFHSLCEHHMLPFMGRVAVAYIPGEHVVGLSKIPRAVKVFAARLQVQERLTAQIADAIEHAVGARGVAVQITATHLCMQMRGVQTTGAFTTTSAFRGVCAGPDDTAREWRQQFREHVAAARGSS